MKSCGRWNFIELTSVISPLNTTISDVGQLFGCSGQIDFYINGHLQWAIEILREDERT